MTAQAQQGRFQPLLPVHWQDLIAAARHSLTLVPPATAADQWTKMYREGNHRRIRDSLYNNRQQMSNGGVYFAGKYRSLHNVRIQADYNPRVSYDEQDATVWIDRAETAVQTPVAAPARRKGGRVRPRHTGKPLTPDSRIRSTANKPR